MKFAERVLARAGESLGEAARGPARKKKGRAFDAAPSAACRRGNHSSCCKRACSCQCGHPISKERAR